MWWAGSEPNQPHGDFQSPALPTELPAQGAGPQDSNPGSRSAHAHERVTAVRPPPAAKEQRPVLRRCRRRRLVGHQAWFRVGLVACAHPNDRGLQINRTGGASASQRPRCSQRAGAARRPQRGVAGAEGLEPSTAGFGIRCATSCAIPPHVRRPAKDLSDNGSSPSPYWRTGEPARRTDGWSWTNGWCEWGDLNPHGHKGHRLLGPACLPISPHSHGC